MFGWKGVKNQEITGAEKKMDELLITMIYWQV